MFRSIFLQRQYFIDNRVPLSLFVVFGLIKNLASFLLSISIGEFFTVYFHTNGSKGKLLKMFGIEFHTLTAFFSMFLLLVFIKGIFDYVERYICFRQGELFVKNIREQIFSTQMGWSNERFKEKYFGKYLLRYSNDMKAIQNYLTKGLMGGFKDLCFLAMGFCMLALINPRLDLIFLLFTSVSMGCIYLVAKRQRVLIINSRTKRSGLLSTVARSFQRHNSIKEKQTEQLTLEKFNRNSEELYQTNMLNNRFESFLQSLLSFQQYLVIGLVLWFMTFHEFIRIHKGSALVFVLIMLLMVSPMKRVLKVPSILNKGRVSLEKINELLLGRTGNDDQQPTEILEETNF